jgi:hypothetical protein
MTVSSAARRRESAQHVRTAVDAVLPRLKTEEIDQLAADISELGARPQILLRAISLARALVDEQTPKHVLPALHLTGSGHGRVISPDEGARRLEKISELSPPETWAGSDLLGPEAIAERLGISRGTLHNWRRDGQVIALRKGLRNHVYPVRQFSDTGPLAGIGGVLSVIDNPDEAWEWLITPNRATRGEAPLVLLERGESELVHKAASSALDFA